MNRSQIKKRKKSNITLSVRADYQDMILTSTVFSRFSTQRYKGSVLVNYFLAAFSMKC